MNRRDHDKHIRKLAEIGIALSSEKNMDRLLELIVDEARELTGADAGTLYIVDTPGKHLEFVILQNDTMKTRMGGTSGAEITLPPVPLYDPQGTENHANVSSHAALTGEIVNIEDVYEAEGFDFTGPRKYDAATGYRSKSMLVIPMANHEGEMIGVLQLLNALDAQGEPSPFDDRDVDLIASLASQAAVALTNAQLIRDLKNLLYSFIRSIASAIDAKSPYTAGHINRVVDLTMLIAEMINEQDRGPFSGVHFDEYQMEELRLAAWMHDVGKITTPEHVVDKSTKLQAVFDREQLVALRYDLIEKTMYAEHLEKKLELCSNGSNHKKLAALDDGFDELMDSHRKEKEFVLGCNRPGEFMDKDKQERIKVIGEKQYGFGGQTYPFLEPDEVENLNIARGSLTMNERKVIENHARVTHDMLTQLPFPKRLARVPEYAAGHHEKLDGTGYPFGLDESKLPLQARILAVADVFEALTAKDRPYKKPMKLSQAVKILGFMKKDRHIDADVFDLFISSGLYRQYAEKELAPEQLDDIQVD